VGLATPFVLTIALGLLGGESVYLPCYVVVVAIAIGSIPVLTVATGVWRLVEWLAPGRSAAVARSIAPVNQQVGLFAGGLVVGCCMGFVVLGAFGVVMGWTPISDWSTTPGGCDGGDAGERVPRRAPCAARSLLLVVDRVVAGAPAHRAAPIGGVRPGHDDALQCRVPARIGGDDRRGRAVPE
jgi:hypothetical protein